MLFQAPHIKECELPGCNRQLAVGGLNPDTGLASRSLQQHSHAAASFIITVFLTKSNWYFHFLTNKYCHIMVCFFPLDRVKKVILYQNPIKNQYEGGNYYAGLYRREQRSC